jgi:glucose/arabinose dehydrogenase
MSPRSRGGALLIACAVVALVAVGAGPCGRYRSTVVASGFGVPVFVTAPAGDPRLFVVELGGRIRIVDASGAVLPVPFLDISARVLSGFGELGLLGLAFPPDFASSGAFYVYYTDLAGDSQLSRFLLLPGESDRADPDSERELLSVEQPDTNHNGGTIAFGPHDGMLYLGLGDGGGSNDQYRTAQDPQSLLGKMLRLDVSGGPDAPYTIPPDNPWAGDAAVRGEIWAFGLRNPYRFFFDRQTGDLWIADVGSGSREEVNFEPAGSPGGLNWGWPVHEGSLCYFPAAYPGLSCDDPSAPDSYAFPLWEYDHGQGCAIIGGPAYRGASLPLPGWNWFADLCSGRVWTFFPVGPAVDMTSRVAPPGGFPSAIAGSGEDGFGEIHWTTLGGTIHRLEHAPDADGDGIPDARDNCPLAFDRSEADADGDGLGDACDPTP